MKKPFLSDTLNGIEDSRVIEIGGVRVIDFPSREVTLDDVARFWRMISKVQFCESISRRLRRCLFQDEMHSTTIAEFLCQKPHVGNDLQSEFESLPRLMHLFSR